MSLPTWVAVMFITHSLAACCGFLIAAMLRTGGGTCPDCEARYRDDLERGVR